MAKVLIFRPTSFWEYRWFIFLDKKRISTINGGQLLEFEISSGKHNICCAKEFSPDGWGWGEISIDDDLEKLKKTAFHGIDDFDFIIQKNETKIFRLRKNRLKIFIYTLTCIVLCILVIMIGILIKLPMGLALILALVLFYYTLFRRSKKLKIFCIKFEEKSETWLQTFTHHNPETGKLQIKKEKLEKSAGRFILEGSICSLIGIYSLYEYYLNEGEDFNHIIVLIILILYGAIRIYEGVKKI